MINKALILITLFIHLVPFSQTTFTLQPNSSQGKDASTYSASPTFNNGTSDAISKAVGSNAMRRIYIEFDISTLNTNIPENAIIVDADIELRLRWTSMTTALTDIDVVDESWGEGSITWNHAPAVSSSPSTITLNPVPLGSYWYGFDVTSHVQHFVNYPHLNNGWRLKCDDENLPSSGLRGATYCSSDYTNYHPKLVVEYVLPIEITLDQITHADTPTSSNGSISVNVDEGNGSYSYQWIDGSTGNNITGETSSSISGLSPGWYGVEVTDGLGNVSYMAFIVGAKCGVVQVDFQPDGRFVDDTYIRTGVSNSQSFDDRNYGATSSIESDNYYLNHFYFGLSDYTSEFLFRNRLIIANNIEIIKADQTFYGFSHAQTISNESQVFLNTEDWQEDVATWTIRPTHDPSNSFTLPATSSSSENKVLDQELLYQDYQSGAYNNFGYTVQLTNPSISNNERMRFYSSDYTGATSGVRPKLTLEVGKLCFSGYTKLKRQKDASYTFTQFGVLKFYFEQPYQMYGNDLEIRLYEEDKTEISLTNLPAVDYDDNRVDLDLSSLGLTQDQFYYIEVTPPKGGKRYLRFQYKN